MYKLLLLTVFFCLGVLMAGAQQRLTIKKDSVSKINPTSDTLKSVSDTVKPYVNVGKIAGRRAAIRSAMLPGLGQIRNGFTLYRGLKVAAIYTGATLLTISYIDNAQKYDIFYNELKYRQEHGGNANPNSPYKASPTDRLIQAKDIYRRNKQVIIFSYAGLYLLNIIEAYIDARLANFDVGDVARIKVTPHMINSGQLYGFNAFNPGVKIAISF